MAGRESGHRFFRRMDAYAGLRLTALEPRASGWMSKETRWPSARLRIPAASTAVACTNTSLAPPSGEIKPKPLFALKNFTVPIAVMWSLNVGFRTSFYSGGAIGRFISLGSLAVSSSAHEVRSGAYSALLLTGRRREIDIRLCD